MLHVMVREVRHQKYDLFTILGFLCKKAELVKKRIIRGMRVLLYSHNVFAYATPIPVFRYARAACSAWSHKGGE